MTSNIIALLIGILFGLIGCRRFDKKIYEIRNRYYSKNVFRAPFTYIDAFFCGILAVGLKVTIGPIVNTMIGIMINLVFASAW